MDHEEVISVDPISIAHCREILGADADDLSDADVDAMRRHAETLAGSL